MSDNINYKNLIITAVVSALMGSIATFALTTATKYFYPLNIVKFDSDTLSGRSAQAGFNKSDIASFSLIIPDKRILNFYRKITWTLREKMLQCKAENIALENLRDSLLPKLLSGEIEIRG